MSYLLLGRLRALGDLFNDVAVMIPSREVHGSVGVDRILREDGIYEADALEEVLPVERRKQAHARNDVAHGDLSGRLALMFMLNNNLRGYAFALELPLEPVERRPGFRVLIPQALRELNDEG